MPFCIGGFRGLGGEAQVVGQVLGGVLAIDVEEADGTTDGVEESSKSEARVKSFRLASFLDILEYLPDVGEHLMIYLLLEATALHLVRVVLLGEPALRELE
jgi:hypothetical protein